MHIFLDFFGGFSVANLEVVLHMFLRGYTEP